MKYRPPCRHDIGKTVEVSADGLNWQNATLDYIGYGHGTAIYNSLDNGVNDFWEHCRVLVSSESIAELGVAADWLAERGMDNAATVLLERVSGRMQWNLNERVRVRLTDLGRSLFRRYHIFTVGINSAFHQKPEDENGFSEWQMWELMQVFGKHISTMNTSNGCFESMWIEIVTPNQCELTPSAGPA